MLEVILFVDRYSHNRRWKAHVVGALSRNISARWKLIACSTTSYRILIPLHWEATDERLKATNTGQPLSSRPSRLIGETEIRFEGRASRLRSSTEEGEGFHIFGVTERGIVDEWFSNFDRRGEDRKGKV